MTTLAERLRDAVQAQRFETLPDALRGGAPLDAYPSLDLALCCFDGDRPQALNLLFSREHPQGLVGAIAPGHGALGNIGFVADLQDASGASAAWLPGADWQTLRFAPLAGCGTRFVAPYPASLLKLMIATGVAAWAPDIDAAWTHEGESRRLREWQHAMLSLSCNRSTDALVAFGHAAGWLAAEAHQPHALHRLFERLGLRTLRLADTTPRGGWRNADGAGVGHLQMTAWDSLRLLWWLDPEAPPCPWSAEPRLQGPGLKALWAALQDQRLHGWLRHPGFAHKTGNTENYASDAGRLRLGDGRLLFVAMTSSLGARYAQGDPSGFPLPLQQLGEALLRLFDV